MTTAVQRVSLDQKRSIIYEAWKKTYPEGLILDDPSYKFGLVEVWDVENGDKALPHLCVMQDAPLEDYLQRVGGGDISQCPPIR
jgi:hypothetical protein